MADKKVEILISAEDQASSVLQKIGSNLSNLTSSVNKSGSATNSYAGNVNSALQGVNKSWSNLSSKVMELPGIVSAAAGITVGAIAKMGIQAAASVESSTVAFKTLTGSAEEANRIILRIQDAAKKTPFDQQSLINMNQLLIGSGLNADLAFDTVMQLGDALAATGKGSAEMARIGNTISQVFGKGKADVVDFKEIVNAGWVTVRKDVADSMGVTIAQFGDMVSAGEVGFEQIQKALVKATGEGGRFFNAMEAQSHTFNGALSNLFDTLNIQLGTLFRDTGMFDGMKSAIIGITGFLSSALPVITQGFKDVFAVLQPIGQFFVTMLGPVIQFVGQHQELQRVIVAVAIGFSLFMAALLIILPIITLVSSILGIIGAIGGVIVSVFTLLSTAIIPALIAVFTFLLSPLGLIVLAIAAVIAIGYMLITHWEQVKAVASNVWATIVALISAAWEKIKAIFATVTAFLLNMVTSWLQRTFGLTSTQMNSILNVITQVLQSVAKAFSTNLENAYSTVKSIGNGIIGVFNAIKGAIEAVIGKLQEFASQAAGAVGSVRGKLGFQHGGVIPGSFNQPVPAILHGGERVIPRTGVDVNPAPGGSGGGGGPVTIVIEGDVNSMDTLDKMVSAVKAALGRDNELSQLGVAV